MRDSHFVVEKSYNMVIYDCIVLFMEVTLNQIMAHHGSAHNTCSMVCRILFLVE